MRIFRVPMILTMVVLILSALTAGAQRPSPPGVAELTVGGKKITINYSRPSAKGRKIFGGLVPYDQVWRAGANEATSLKTETDLVFGKTVVPAGSYTLFAVPSEKGWKLIINKHTGQWGIPYKYESEELARIDMKVGKTSAMVEQFTISLTAAGKGGMLKMEWENTSASVNFMAK